MFSLKKMIQKQLVIFTNTLIFLLFLIRMKCFLYRKHVSLSLCKVLILILFIIVLRPNFFISLAYLVLKNIFTLTTLVKDYFFSFNETTLIKNSYSRNMYIIWDLTQI